MKTHIKLHTHVWLPGFVFAAAAFIGTQLPNSGDQFRATDRAGWLWLWSRSGAGQWRVQVCDPANCKTAFSLAPILWRESRGYVDAPAQFRVGPETLKWHPSQRCLEISDPDGTTEYCLQEQPVQLTINTSKPAAWVGLGAQFPDIDRPHGNWVGQTRVPGNKYGNAMMRYHEGDTGNAQFPFAYLFLDQKFHHTLFIDEVRPLTWQVGSQSTRITGFSSSLRWVHHHISSPLAAHRQHLQDTGLPLLPPLKALGLWISEYGYDNWKEADSKILSLQENGFPLDGVVLDLQWFGGIREGSADSAMGRLQWDEENFPEPKKKIREWRERGLGVIPIEESYVSQKVASDAPPGQLGPTVVFDELSRRGFLVTTASSSVQEAAGNLRDPSPDKQHVVLNENPWWGVGGMLDWLKPEAGSFWHHWKRKPLIQAGVMGHWTDLGEPEQFSPRARYGAEGLPPEQAHNRYNLEWARSIRSGYLEEPATGRPRTWILSRSGTSGIAGFGAMMWSGDISATLEDLRAHLSAHHHMSVSGMPYYSTDTGGFYHRIPDPTPEDTYTRWFAVSSLIDIPLRVHTQNLCNCWETAPDRRGDRSSNLANLRRRYQLIPYLRSLATKASTQGDPVISPMWMHHPSRATLPLMEMAAEPHADPGGEPPLELWDHKSIGPNLITKLETKPRAKETQIYVPGDDFWDWESGIPIKPGWRTRPLLVNSFLMMPLLARGIVPVMDVPKDRSINAMAANGPATLGFRVFPSGHEAEAELVFDDGTTEAYHLPGHSARLWIRAEAGSSPRPVFTMRASGNLSRLPDQIYLEVAKDPGYERSVVDISPLKRGQRVMIEVGRL